MSPKPLYRSLTFWSGVLMIGFISWLWMSSISRTSSISKGHLKVSMRHAGIEIFYRGWIESPFLTRSGEYDYPVFNRGFAAPFWGRGEGRNMMDEIGFNRTPDPKVENYANAIRQITLKYARREDWLLFIPHWLILFTTALAWCSLLLWRGRRHRAAMQASPGSPS